MLTLRQAQVIKQTWTLFRKVDPNLLGEIFYSKLFIEYPSLQPLFKAPIERQYVKLFDMLNVMVAYVDRPADLITKIHQLGLRHKEYQVKPEHFTHVGEALLWTLKSGLGNQWDSEVEVCWTVLYKWASAIMIGALSHKQENVS